MRDPYCVEGQWYFYRENKQYGPYSSAETAQEKLDFYNNYMNHGECTS